MNRTIAEQNQDIANQLSNNLLRLLFEFSRDFERQVLHRLHQRGHEQIRPSHSALFSNLGLGAVRVTELAERAQVTQQAMGKMLKEVERLGYITRDIDPNDKRAREIRLTDAGIALVSDCMAAVAEVREHYAGQTGEEELNQLEDQLRKVVKKINLSYLPRSWADKQT